MWTWLKSIWKNWWSIQQATWAFVCENMLMLEWPFDIGTLTVKKIKQSPEYLILCLDEVGGHVRYLNINLTEPVAKLDRNCDWVTGEDTHYGAVALGLMFVGIPLSILSLPFAIILAFCMTIIAAFHLMDSRKMLIYYKIKNQLNSQQAKLLRQALCQASRGNVVHTKNFVPLEIKPFKLRNGRNQSSEQ